MIDLKLLPNYKNKKRIIISIILLITLIGLIAYNFHINVKVAGDNYIPSQLILLWEADMHVDQSGEDVGYEARLEDIGSRLGFDSEPYRICSKTIEWLKQQEVKVNE